MKSFYFRVHTESGKLVKPGKWVAWKSEVIEFNGNVLLLGKSWGIFEEIAEQTDELMYLILFFIPNLLYLSIYLSVRGKWSSVIDFEFRFLFSVN